MPMEKLIQFKIDGKPQAKQSVKFAKIGNFIKKYTPKEMVNYSNWVKQCFKMTYPEHLPSEFIDCYLKVKIVVHVEMPKSFSKRKQDLAYTLQLRPTVKPDCDNIAKNILDSLNGICYPDDKQIIMLSIEKIYDKSPFVEVKITGYKNGK